jgi:hypothetical protein
MRRRGFQRRRRDMTLLVGWLFADLLLGLMMIFLISAPGAASKALTCLLTPTTSRASAPSSTAPEMVRLQFTEQGGGWHVSRSLVRGVPFTRQESKFAPAITCPTPTPTSTQTPTPTPNKNAISQQSVDFDFQSNPDALLAGDTTEQDRLQGLILQQFSAQFNLDTDQAGFVLTFGTTPDPANAKDGENLAAAFNTILQGTLPHFFSRAKLRAFHNIGSPRGHITLEVYLFVVGR